MSKTMILYFSKTGTTKKLAEAMAQRLQADIYEIKEAQPYTSSDLDWTVPTSRANKEQGDDTSRPAYVGSLPDLSSYDRIIIGHPTWWGRPPRIIQTVLEDLDLSDKEVASFATSGGSTYADSQLIIRRYAPHAKSGRVLRNDQDADRWLASIGFLIA